ncbi:MAG TPA: ABC transporter ATP-binding protein [Conexibacter sp.]|nr:ABC transporter ATP-binding protein [Conexibacter sp.]
MSAPLRPAPTRNETALSLAGLDVRLLDGDPIVEQVDVTLAAGEILGLVGESGSGKTTTALSLLGYSPDGVEINGGSLAVAGVELRMDDSMRASRGSVISYVPQDPSRALNPSLRIAEAIEDIFAAHGDAHATGERRAIGVAARMLDTVGLPATPAFARRFPHQLSGGQQQRVSIAVALACDPAVVVLDEPTTGLDVVTQARILSELLRLRDEQRISMVYVTHDLAVVARIADRIAVMYAGRIVEQGRAETVLRHPRHPYTRGLLASIPDHVRPRALEPMPGIAVGVGERPTGCAFAPRCPQRTERCEQELPPLDAIGERHEVRCFHWQQTPPVKAIPLAALRRRRRPQEPLLRVERLHAEHRSRSETFVAAHDVSFAVARGACVALVGESGSGKTTIARAIAGLHPVAGGRILLDEQELPSLIRRRSTDQRRRVQLVSQNPADALNPRHTVRDTIGRPARVLRGLDGRALPAEVDRLLECVRLPARLASRYPRELSGGERQRVAIARALAADPELMLCDEITSALDVSVQAAVLKLLNDLRDDLGLSLLFITHDLGVVASVADELLVLENGAVCERGPTATVLSAPEHPYTQRLLQAAPSVAEAIDAWDAREAVAATRETPAR